MVGKKPNTGKLGSVEMDMIMSTVGSALGGLMANKYHIRYKDEKGFEIEAQGDRTFVLSILKAFTGKNIE